ncbi:hypothetical protein H072_11502 [Dactylellina haptotyla CBS 200.50]|uniref:3-methyl-2-oxobutanoate hydroxymethyltransferase n=1 Tax=Dactylellina haptotyla (strain CBS 200.50) TaxID=1284197 RepID=S8A1T1_DACHA|nr:hypothetical protein H072_11502 [Dactylellina haptotyla CBS 200.50]
MSLAAVSRTACRPSSGNLLRRSLHSAARHPAPILLASSHAAVAGSTCPRPSHSHSAPGFYQPQHSAQFHTTTQKASSHAPMSFSDLSTRKKVTINTLRKMYEKGEKITMITAHDFPSGILADQAGIDCILVGDSLAMVGLGMEDTNQISLDDMLHHSRAVARGVRSAFLVADLPMGSYELSPKQALQSSIALVQKGRATSVKIEGGKEIAPTIKAITTMGIPVLAHIGLTPQRQGSLGGFVVQSKTAASASKLLSDALAVQDAGAWGVVLEAVPADVARLVTEALDIPTIGIGAGEGTSGQVLVQIDMLGNFPTGRFLPKFVKKYADVFEVSKKALVEFKDEVKSGQYPAQEHTYPVKEQEVAEFKKIVEHRKPEIDASKERRRSFD